MHISQLKNQIPQLIERSSYPYISVYKYDHVAHIYILRIQMKRYKTKTCQRIALHWVVRRQLNAVRALARLYLLNLQL